MGVVDFMRRRATLQEFVKADDNAFGETFVVTSLASVRCRVGTISSSVTTEYARHGWLDVIRLQCENRFPTTVLGTRSFSEVFRAANSDRLRLLLDGRTLTVVAVEFPNEGGDGPVDFANIDCVETTGPVGYPDA